MNNGYVNHSEGALLFVKLITAYYGEDQNDKALYNRLVADWYDKQGVPRKYLRRLFNLIAENISRKYNYRPDITDLNRVYAILTEQIRLEHKPVALLATDSVVDRETAVAEMNRIMNLLRSKTVSKLDDQT